MTGQPFDEPYVVYAGLTAVAAEHLAGRTAAAGGQVFRLDLTGVRDTTELCERYGATFAFPFPFRGLAAVVSLVSDLEWLGPRDSRLLLIEGLDDADPEIVFDAAAVLPNIVDRWRTQEQPFVAALVGTRSADVALSALAEENAALVRHAARPHAIPDTGPVTVVDCRTLPKGRAVDT